MKLKTKLATYAEVDYHDLEQLIQDVYDQPDYSVVAEEEWDNDTSHTFTVERQAPNEWVLRDVEQFRTTGNGQYKLGSLLEDLCFNDHIEPGDYLVNVCW